ncbi:MAG: hypothetical protein ABS879_07175 [Eubacteriales bacterium]
MKKIDHDLMNRIIAIAQAIAAAAEKGDVKRAGLAYSELARLLGSREEEKACVREAGCGSPLTIFDNTRAYNTHVRPRMEELTIICNGLIIPFYTTVCIQNDELRTTYRSFSGSPGVRNINLGNDMIRAHELLQIGYELRPPRTENDALFNDEEVNIDPDEFTS